MTCNISNILRLIAATTLCLAASGCTKEFKLKGLDTKPRAFVEFLPCGQDSSLVKLFRAYPPQMMIDDQTLDSFVDDPAGALSIEVDGVPVVVENDALSLACVRRRFSPGETVSVRIDLGDGCKAESSTVIPPAVTDCKVNRVGDDIVLDYKADLFPEYVALLPDYITTTSRVEGGETITTVRHGGYVMHFDTEYRSDLAGEMVGAIHSLAFNDSRIYFWKDSDAERIDGGWHRMKFRISSSIYTGGLEYDRIEVSYEFEFHVYGIHEDLYRYMNNQLDIENNEYGQQGLAPTVFNWTNVKDGFGIVAGMSHISTGWFSFDD